MKHGLTSGGQIENDEEIFHSLKSQLTQVQNLQNEEIVRLKKMLDEAQKPSLIDDIFNLVLTFFIGVGSSLFAVYGWSKWKKWRTKGISHTGT